MSVSGGLQWGALPLSCVLVSIFLTSISAQAISAQVGSAQAVAAAQPGLVGLETTSRSVDTSDLVEARTGSLATVSGGDAAVVLTTARSDGAGDAISLPAAVSSPNIVLIFTDDQGYGDVGCYGAKGFQTPSLDLLAKQGRKFTDFYVAQAVCGTSRAALLTGCYPNRIGLFGAPGPNATHGISASEMTLAELVKQKQYATAIVGKWHLGHRLPFLPLQHGFDQYYGLPYSNDMWPHHPEKVKFPPLPLIRNNQIIDSDVDGDDQTHLIEDYTKEACDFIRKHKDAPFFLYLAHSLPHVPLYGNKRFAGSSEQGRYGDIIQEIDWSVGEVLKCLDEVQVADNTLVIFTTDNGPWLSYGNHAGSTGGLREGKGTAFEGGVRVPCLMRWPGKIPAGSVCRQPCATIDVVPTIAKLIGGQLPDHKIDGLDISPLLFHDDVQSPHEFLYYYYGTDLCGIRSGDWKLVFPHRFRSLTGAPGNDGSPAGYSQQTCKMGLYHLRNDPAESIDLQDQHPEIVARLERYAQVARTQMGDSLNKAKGNQLRPRGVWQDPNAAK